MRSGRLAQSETAPAIRDPLSSQMHSSAQANHHHGFPEGEGVGVGVGRVNVGTGFCCTGLSRTGLWSTGFGGVGVGLGPWLQFAAASRWEE